MVPFSGHLSEQRSPPYSATMSWVQSGNSLQAGFCHKVKDPRLPLALCMHIHIWGCEGRTAPLPGVLTAQFWVWTLC